MILYLLTQQPHHKKRLEDIILKTKTLSILLVCMVLCASFLTACQSNHGEVEDSIDEKFTTQDSTVQTTDGVSYEVTQSDLNVYQDKTTGQNRYIGIVEVVNNGSVNLQLKDAVFNVVDADETIIQKDVAIPAFPSIIRPKEKGYYYFDDLIQYDNKLNPNHFKLKADVSASETNNPITRLTVENDDMSEQDNVYHFTCDIKNELDHNVYLSDLNIWYLLYNEQGKMIGRFCFGDKNIEKGTTESFEYDFDSNNLPGPWSGSKIYTYKVLAFETEPA